MPKSEENKFRDIKANVGKIINNRHILSIDKRVRSGRNSVQYYLAVCVCGLSDPQLVTLRQVKLTRGCQKCSSGVKGKRRNKSHLQGLTFNNLKVLELVGYDRKNNSLYRCECLLCGNDNYTVIGSRVKNGYATRCNLHTPNHGFSKDDAIYDHWTSMVQRATSILKYIERGGIQESWLPSNNGYLNFREWLLEKYPNAYDLFKDNYTIDRENNDFGYFDWNCRLATKKMQSRNRTRTVKKEFNGKLMALSDIYDSFETQEKPSYGTFYQRIKEGKTIEEAIKKYVSKLVINLDGVEVNLREIYDIAKPNFHLHTLKRRVVRNKQSLFEALDHYYTPMIDEYLKKCPKY